MIRKQGAARHWWFVLGLLVGCHDHQAPPRFDPLSGFDAGAGPGGVVVASDGGTVGGGGGDVGCPAAPPAEAAACAAEGIECEYGADPRRSCRAYARCTGRHWALSRQDCAPLPNVTCPASAADARGVACPTLPAGAYCSWDPDLACECTDCTPTQTTQVCTGNPVWTCPATPAAGCPAALPRSGSPCAGALTCDYGCAFGARVCAAGRWRSQPPVCPP